MPAVELCSYGEKEIDSEKEQFVVLALADKSNPRSLAHVECHQKAK